MKNVSGIAKDDKFAANIDLFVFNVVNKVSKEQITGSKKDTKWLDIVEIEKHLIIMQDLTVCEYK